MQRLIKNASRSYLEYAEKLLAKWGIHHAYYPPTKCGTHLVPGIIAYDGTNPNVREFQHELGWY